MNFRFAPGRGPAVAASAMVATSQAPATLAGLEILRLGGNAVDAAIAAAACLCVAEPMSNGLGGDCFALVWDGEVVHGLDAGGAAPRSAPTTAPADSGPSSAVVPAVVAGWAEMSRRFGRLGLDACLRPAIDLAERGVAAGFHCAYAWSRAANAPAALGAAPRVGELFRLPGLAASLRTIATRGPDAFYWGPIADAIVAASWLEPEDLAAVEARWVRPLSLHYKGVEVVEMPAPTQGVAPLEGLGLLERLGEPTPANQVRAVALALEDARSKVRDGADVSGLIETDFLDERTAAAPRLIPEPKGGTVYLCVVDGDGMAVSFIQSLYDAFGSSVAVPDTGIVLNNRASCFEVSGTVEPGRRPYHTTIPGMLVENGKLRGPFGVMGGFIQAQAHVQLVSALVDRRLDPQAALDLPRFRLDHDAVRLEEGLWADHEEYLLPGAQVILDEDRLSFGGGQAIQITEGRMLGGSDPRKDGFAAGF
jgi:gamma-glutamyltranspeptidase/glutathione hydrolase